MKKITMEDILANVKAIVDDIEQQKMGAKALINESINCGETIRIDVNSTVSAETKQLKENFYSKIFRDNERNIYAIDVVKSEDDINFVKDEQIEMTQIFTNSDNGEITGIVHRKHNHYNNNNGIAYINFAPITIFRYFISGKQHNNKGIGQMEIEPNDYQKLVDVLKETQDVSQWNLESNRNGGYNLSNEEVGLEIYISYLLYGKRVSLKEFAKNRYVGEQSRIDPALNVYQAMVKLGETYKREQPESPSLGK